MKRVSLAAGFLVLCGMLAGAGTALAVPFDNQPKILLHIKTISTKNQCTTWGTLADCKDAVTEANLTPVGGPGYYYVYLLASNAGSDNLAGLQCGIAYENNMAADITNGSQVDVFGWTLCATLEFITPRAFGNVWPEPGGGSLITWDSVNRCQTGDVGVAGYFYMAGYTAGTMRVTKRPVDMTAKTADCNSMEADPLGNEDLGFVAFSAGAATLGCNPCDAPCADVPVEPTTWSGIKNLIGR